MQTADDGDHYRLAFDRPGTWSQKYNLVWDRILGLYLFPPEVARKEIEFYRQIQNRYGFPLDNRQPYTKLDWILWTATLTQDRDDFQAIVDPVIAFLNETPDRVPMTDWYFTHDAHRVGFTARPVVGGVFLRLLYDRPVWQKFASRDTTRASGWAPMPSPPQTTPLVPTSQHQPTRWQFTTQSPAPEWFATDFDDRQWQTGQAGFGVENTPGAVVRTPWTANDIWLRRRSTCWIRYPSRWLCVFITMKTYTSISMESLHCRSRDTQPITKSSTLIHASCAGQNVMAVHCRQTQGGQYIDVGIDTIMPGVHD